MKKIKRCAAAVSAAVMLSAVMPLNCFAEESSVNMREIVIDGSNANTKENMRY